MDLFMFANNFQLKQALHIDTGPYGPHSFEGPDMYRVYWFLRNVTLPYA